VAKKKLWLVLDDDRDFLVYDKEADADRAIDYMAAPPRPEVDLDSDECDPDRLAAERADLEWREKYGELPDCRACLCADGMGKMLEVGKVKPGNCLEIEVEIVDRWVPA
jgi:hypothetical protein